MDAVIGKKCCVTVEFTEDNSFANVVGFSKEKKVKDTFILTWREGYRVTLSCHIIKKKVRNKNAC